MVAAALANSIFSGWQDREFTPNFLITAQDRREPPERIAII